jgi:hypothetical protein
MEHGRQGKGSECRAMEDGGDVLWGLDGGGDLRAIGRVHRHQS